MWPRSMCLVVIATLVAGCTASERATEADVPLGAEDTLATAIPEVDSSKTPDQVFDLISRSVVLVLNDEADRLGSGVELMAGLFVTNCHVLTGGAQFAVQRDGDRVAAVLYRSSADRDICLLSAPGLDAAPAKTRSAATLRVGEVVYALGNPQGLEQTFSSGIVSQLRRSAGANSPPYVQTTAPISQGSSGGGLFDADGNLVGVPSFMLREGQNLNFAAPIDWAIELAEGLSGSSVIASSASDTSAEGNAPETLATLGRNLIRSGKPEEAIPHLEEAVRVLRDAEVVGNLGYAYLLTGRLASARDALEQSLGIEPGRAASWLNLGQVQALLGTHDVAVASVIRGYGLASRKTAVIEGLTAARSNQQEDERWRAVATVALSRLASNDSSPSGAGE
jgi:tetratricopeptide (TPR) repeat protein